MRGKIATGILWNVIDLLFSKGLSYLTILLLARLLDPETFGQLGMATVFTSFILSIGNSSVTRALIQHKKARLSEELLSSTRTLLFVSNALIWIFYCIVVSPLVAQFYDVALLTSIIPVIALQGLVGAFNVIPRAQLSRLMRFKSITIAQSVAAIVANLTALCLVYLGFGIWGLVAHLLLIEAIQIPLLRRAAHDRGRFAFSLKSIRDIFRFTSYESLIQSLIQLTKNVDYLLVGKLLGSQLLGIYTMAFMLTDMLRGQLMNVINRAMFPVFSIAQNEPKRIKDYYLKVVRYNTLCIGPIMLIFVLYSEEWVPVLLGDDWGAAIIPIQLIAISSWIHTIGGSTDSVLKALGKVDLVFRISVLKFVFIALPAFFVGIYFFGINGAAAAMVIHKLATRIIYQHYMSKFLGVRCRDLFYATGPHLIGLASGLLCFGLWHLVIASTGLSGLILESLSVATLAFSVAMICIRKELSTWLGAKSKDSLPLA